MAAKIIGRGYITIAGLKDGDPSVMYRIVCSVDSITRSMTGVLSVTSVKCHVFKITGKTKREPTGEKTLRYRRVGEDSAERTVSHAGGVTGDIAVTSRTERIEFSLYDSTGVFNDSTLLDRETISVVTDAGDLEVGGRNMLRNSAWAGGDIRHWSIPAVSRVDTTASHEGRNSVRTQSSGNTANRYAGVTSERYGCEAGRAYTLSGWIKADDMSLLDAGLRVEIDFHRTDGTRCAVASHTPALTEGEWTRFVYTRTAPDDAATVRAYAYVTKNGEALWNGFKLECGNTATAWSPAPEDLEERVDTFDYLKEALAQNGYAEAGLALRSLIKLGVDTNVSDLTQKTWAGMNGIYANGRSIASWWGGDMVDRFYASDVMIKPAPANAAAALVRMDGSAYFANGNIGFRTDGSGWFGTGSSRITWNPNGQMTFGNGIKIDIGGNAQGLAASMETMFNFINGMSRVIYPVDSAGKKVEWRETAKIYAVRSEKGIYSDSFVSARGENTGAGSGGGSGSSLFGLLKVWPSAHPGTATSDALGANLGWELRESLRGVMSRVDVLEGKGHLENLALQVAGSGNAVTSISKNGTVITVNKGTTFLTSHQSLASCVTLNTAQTIAANKRFSAQILKNGVSKSWFNGRDAALLRMDSVSAYSPLISMKTKEGSWEMGSYDNASNQNSIWFTYVTDANYGESKNVASAQIRLNPDSTIFSQGFRKSGSSNSYLLLGGGGHKALTDITSAYVTGLGTSGDYLTWTRNGVTNNLTIPYATSAKQLANNARMEYGWNGLNYFNANLTAGCEVKTNDSPTTAWWHILRFNHANNSGYYTDLAVPFNSDSLYWKCVRVGALAHEAWVKILDALNYASVLDGRYYTETEINTKLTNGSVTKIGTTTVGGTAQPIYLNGGTPAALSVTVGSATRPVYLNNGVITVGTYAFGNGSGNAPVSNGTLNTNLNADMLDGTHKTGLFTALANSGDNISATIGGTTKVLTVGFATKAKRLTYCSASVGNTNNWAFHRILKTETITGQYSDACGVYLISQGYNAGGFGVFRIAVRTNSSTSASTCEIGWIIRRGFSADAIQVGFNNTHGNTYADVFYVSKGTYANVTVSRLVEGGRGRINESFTMVDSTEVSNTTTSDKKTSTECYSSLANAASVIGRTYNANVTSCPDIGQVNSVNKLQDAHTIWGQSFNGTANVSGNMTGVGTITASGEIKTTAANGFRIAYGHYGTFFRNDSANTWWMLTAKDDVSGTYNALRPLRLNNETGDLTLGNGSLFVKHLGNVGVGTSSPAYKLDVAGTLHTTGQATLASLKIGEVTITYDSDGKGLKISGGGLYSESYISARGLNADGSSTTGLVKKVYNIDSINSTFSKDDLTNTFNAHAIKSINERLKTIESGAGTTVVTNGSGNAVTAVSKSGNTITVTKGSNFLTGITKAQVEAVLTGTIQTHNHDYLQGIAGGAVTKAPGDRRMILQVNVNKGTEGLFPHNNNANAIIGISKHPGNYLSQLGFSSNGSIYYRSFNGAAVDATTAWERVLTSSNTKITGKTITINGSSITVLTAHQSISNLISGAGVMEVGRYMDFHSANYGTNTTEDYTVRLDAGAASTARILILPATPGTLATQEWVTGKKYLTIHQPLDHINNLGKLEAVTGATTMPSGLRLYSVYNNGYPCNFGNLLRIGGGGSGELLCGWTGGSGRGGLYYRSKRDVASQEWSAWGTVAFMSDINWSSLSGKPTTLAGYGITDAYDKGESNSKYVTGLGTDGNFLTWTKNGVTENIAVPYSKVAAKLQTSRTIWGQSFNGGGNVSGNMTGVGNITATGLITNTGDLRLQSALTGDVSLELWRNSAASWRFLNSTGTLKIQSNYTTSAGDYFDCLTLNHNTGQMYVKGNVGIGKAPGHPLDVNGQIRATSWIRTQGSTGWLNESHGGGWYMSDDTWIRSYGSKNIYQDSGILRTDGTFQVGSNGNRFLVNTTTVTASLNTRIQSSTGGDISLELWRGDAASWRFLNSGGTLHIQSNYTTKVVNYFDCMTIAHNTGDAAFKSSVAPITDKSGGVGTSTHRWSRLFVASALFGSDGTATSESAPKNTTVMSGGYMEIYRDTPFIDFHFGNSTADYTTRLIEEVSGRLKLIGTFHVTTGMYSDGYVSARGQNTSSDSRLKRILRGVEMDIKDIAGAPAVEFLWRKDGKKDVGSIAQYWKQLIPELAPCGCDGYLTLQYGKAALLASVAIARKVMDHDERIRRLEKENRKLKETIEILQNH